MNGTGSRSSLRICHYESPSRWGRVAPRARIPSPGRAPLTGRKPLRQPAWIHTGLLRPNLLVHDGRLAAVIDFGSVGVGDPAADVITAWSVFSHTGRAVRDALDVDDAAWNRARGFALHQAAMIIPYYAETNPRLVAMSKRTVEEVLADIKA